MTVIAAKFSSAATAAPVNCAAVEGFGDDTVVEVVTLKVVASEVAEGELEWTATGAMGFVGGVDSGDGLVCGGGLVVLCNWGKAELNSCCGVGGDGGGDGTELLVDGLELGGGG